MPRPPLTAFALLLATLLAAPVPLRAQETAAEPGQATTPEAAPEAAALPPMSEIEAAWRAGDFDFVRENLRRHAEETGTALAQYRYGRVLLEGRGGPQDIPAAVDWLERAVASREPNAATLLARAYLSNLPGLPRDPARAARLLAQPAAGGQAEAQYYLGLLLAKGDGVAQDEAAAFNWFEAAARQDHLAAQLALAQAYSQGAGVPADQNAAVRWLERAAEAGDPRAQLALARAYDGDRGIAANPQEAARWYARAAEAGVAGAQRELGLRLLRGRGVPADADAALGWLTRAADAGDPVAQHELGVLYLNGQGVEADESRAALWFMQAADSDLPPAQAALGQLFETGRGVAQDIDRAVALYRAATEAGFVPAARRLGQMAAAGTLDGRLAPQRATPWVLLSAQAGDAGAEDWLRARADKAMPAAQAALARLWLDEVRAARGDGAADAEALGRKAAAAADLLATAAQMGQRDAQEALGQLYATGDAGLAQDYVAAHAWLNLAAAGGHPTAADTRDTLGGLMTPDQIAEAQDIARNFTGGPVAPDTDQTVRTDEGTNDR